MDLIERFEPLYYCSLLKHTNTIFTVKMAPTKFRAFMIQLNVREHLEPIRCEVDPYRNVS